MRNSLTTTSKLAKEKLSLEVDVLELNKIKLQAELDLIKEEIRSKRTARYIMRITATITGLTLLSTIMNYLGLFAK